MVIVFGPCNFVLVISIFESIMLCYLMYIMCHSPVEYSTSGVIKSRQMSQAEIYIKS